MGDTASLEIAPFGTPPYSVRGADEELTLIDAAGSYRRTINGVLVDLSLDQFDKFSLNISCSDQQSPALDNIWPGQEVTISPATYLCYPTATGSPSRPVLSGSQYEANGFTFYRPVLTMMVLAYNIQYNEYNADVSWSLELEEI